MEQNYNQALADWENDIGKLVQIDYQQLYDELNVDTKKEFKPNLVQTFNQILRSLSSKVLLGLAPRRTWKANSDVVDLVKVFNPISLTWENPKYLYSLCLTHTISIYTNNELTKLANFMFEALRNSENVTYIPEPHKG